MDGFGGIAALAEFEKNLDGSPAHIVLRLIDRREGRLD
jgi:hypothetical protein